MKVQFKNCLLFISISYVVVYKILLSDLRILLPIGSHSAPVLIIGVI